MYNKIEIDMLEFQKYIKKIESVVLEIVAANRSFSAQILSLEEAGWRDDIYKASRNQLFRLQEETNKFISCLDEITCELISLRGQIFEKYAKTDFAQISVDMERVEILTDVVLKGDEHYVMSVETLDTYITSTNNYIMKIRTELEDFEICHRAFSESFQTSKYDELSAALKNPLSKMQEILDTMALMVRIVTEKRDFILGLA